MEQRPAEYCCQCDALTGHAGPEEDSLTTSYGEGSYCEECWDKLWAEQDQHPEDDLLERERDKLRDELTQAKEAAERDRNALEATHKRQLELAKERDLAISNRDTLLYLFHEAKAAAERRMQWLEEVDRERRRRKESCLWCNGVAAHDSSCAYLKEKRAYDSPKACPPELRDAESEAPSCPACDTPTPDGEPCLRCAEYAVDSVRAPVEVPTLRPMPKAEVWDQDEYALELDSVVRWLLEQERRTT